MTMNLKTTFPIKQSRNNQLLFKDQSNISTFVSLEYFFEYQYWFLTFLKIIISFEKRKCFKIKSCTKLHKKLKQNEICKNENEKMFMKKLKIENNVRNMFSISFFF